MNTTNPKILIIGLGEIGYHNAEYISQTGLNVEGYDINPKAIQRALNDKVITKESQSFQNYDCYMICVSTHNPQNMFVPYFDGLLSVAERLAVEGKEGALVTIESTIPRGMTDKICDILKHRLHVAHVPHRYFGEEKKEHGVNQLRVLGGCNACCIFEATEFYRDLLGIPIKPVTSPQIAELTKVLENTHRFLEIAFAEELKMFCEEQGLDFEELRASINSKWNENILEARDGIGGHCLPKDTKMFFELSKHLLPNSTIAAAIQSDELYKKIVKKEFFVCSLEKVTVGSIKKSEA
jgi:UDP-N-acetyl-D-mannosaminuronic acid dehydrogenase